MKRRANPFAEKSFGDLSKVAGAMLRGEYDYAGHDRSTHFMDLTEALMEHHDKSRDDLFREMIRGLVGRVQSANGYGPGGGT